MAFIGDSFHQSGAGHRWGWQKSHAYRMIEAAERFQAIENVTQNGSLGNKILPSNESQVRPLTELSDAEAVHRRVFTRIPQVNL